MLSRKSLFALIVVLMCGSLAANKPAAKPKLNPDGSEPGSEVKLERVPPMTPAESLASTEVQPGYRMELVASEPQVVDPIAMAFDEAGRMYVIEMRDYSEKDKARLGRVRMLTDEDGDGKYETSKVFVDDLSWPTAVTCFDGGVFVGSPPDILYFKDTDGDGKADVRKVVYTGFSRTNVQGMLNTLLWGLDHKVYGQTSSAGATVQQPGGAGKPLELRGRDFCFDPKTLELSATTGGGQHGMSFNRWGDRFVCQNSDHLQAIVFEERYLARNPYQSVVSARRSIATDGPQAAVYRISPVEKWRELRTKLRVAGTVPGPVEGGGRASGYFTSATGVTIYEGGLWPKSDEMTALIADVGSNLIHRKRMTPDGVTYRGDRIDSETEFVRSKDIWFRPVQMTIGPDGALYVMDMYREVIEHPASLPAGIKSQLDLSSGDDKGRIYRIVPADYHYAKPKRLAGASASELAAALEDANQWTRMTALRLIYERQDAAAAKALHEQLGKTKRPEGRICVLYALDSVNALADADLMAALGDEHPQVRRHATRLSESRLAQSPLLREKVIALAADAEPVVQFQVALSLGETGDKRATAALAKILQSSNRDIVDAALTSIVDRPGDVLAALLSDGKWMASAASDSIVAAIVGQIARQQRAADLDVLVDVLQRPSGKGHMAGAAVLIKSLSRLPAEALNGSRPPQLVKLRELRQTAAEAIVEEARRTLSDVHAAADARVAAIAELALGKFEAEKELLAKLLSPQEPAAVREAVLATCGQFSSSEVAPLVLAQWPQYSPGERVKATDVLLRRGAWALALVEYLEREGGSITSLDPAHVARLENYPSANVRALARKLHGQNVTADRQQVFNDYREVLAAKGDAAQGKQVFEKNCSVCHEVGGIGVAVGPNLSAMVNRGAESVLYNVLAPNMEVDPRFLAYVLSTSDGQVLNGVIAGETSTAVTLRQQENKTATVLRVDIDDLHTTGKSLMPEGFEKLIDKKAMADLLAFLMQTAKGGGK